MDAGAVQAELKTTAQEKRSYPGIGIPFEENRGQWDREVAFKANIDGGYLGGLLLLGMMAYLSHKYLK